MKHRYIKLLISLLVLINSCKDEKTVYTYSVGNNYLVVDSYYNNGLVKYSKSYNLDTTYSNGPEIYFSEKGRINEWYWFDMQRSIQSGLNEPVTSLNYDPSTNSYKLFGNPFIRGIYDTSKNSFLFETIIPPKEIFNLHVEIKDSFGNKLERRFGFVPGLTDTTAFFEQRIMAGHKYSLYFHLTDINDTNVFYNKKSIDSYGIKVFNERKGKPIMEQIGKPIKE